jgi:hypothetical protein
MSRALKMACPRIEFVYKLESFMNFSDSVEADLNIAANTPGNFSCGVSTSNGRYILFPHYISYHPCFLLSGLAHFQDFRVFKFFAKEYDVIKNGRTSKKTVGVLQCKSDFLDAGTKAHLLLLPFCLRACDKLSLFNFLFFLFSFSRHSK